MELRRSPYESVSDHRLQQMDRALRIVNGHFVLASRLVGLSPVQFKNAVNAHGWLKARWGNKRRGRPRGRTTVRKVVFDFEEDIRKDCHSWADQCMAIFERLSWDEQKRVFEFLKDRIVASHEQLAST